MCPSGFSSTLAGTGEGEKYSRCAERQMFTLRQAEDIKVISQVGDSVATLSNSEEDVYYRIDSMKL